MKTAALSHSGTALVRGEPATGVSEVDDAIGHLVETHLLMADDVAGDRPGPVEPEVAAASLISLVEQEIYRRTAMVDQIHNWIELFRRSRVDTAGAAGASTSIDYIEGSMEVQGYLKLAGDACRGEALVLQPIDHNADELSQLCLPLLDRGVAVRIICQHRGRADLSGCGKMRKLLQGGACVSTVSHVPRSAVVFDRSVAALFGPPEGERSVARVRSQVVVQFLLDLFNHLWESATPLEDADPGYAEVADDLQQAIVRLMAKGYTDEVVARKLGMSVRSCRRHIAALMRELSATSRFQAGVRAATRLLPDAS